MIGEVLTFTVGSGLLLSLIGFLSRSVFRHYLDKDLDKFKANLSEKGPLSR